MAESIHQNTEKTLIEGIVKYISILLHYKWFIIIMTLGVTAATVGFCILSIKLPPEKSPLPNTYAAEATLVLEQNPGGDISSSIMSALGFDPRTAGGSSGYDYGQLVLRILSSRSLIDRLIEQHDIIKKYNITGNVKGKSRDLVLRKSRFLYARESGVITISFEDIDPVFSRDVVNSMVSLLDQWFSQNRGAAKRQQMQMLEEKITEVKTDIQTLEERLKNLQKKYGVLTAQELGASQASSLADLRSQLILRDIEIRNYSSFSKIDDPRIEQLKEERQNIQDLIDQIQRGLPEYQQTSSAPDTASPQSSLADVAQQFTQLTLELDIQRRIYNTLSPQYEATKLSTESEPIFQVLEMAEIPDTKSGPQRSRIVIIAAVAALAGSIAISFLFYTLKQYRNDPEKRKYLTQI